MGGVPMDENEDGGQRQRLLAALDNVRESYDMLRESFDAEVCADLLEWLRVSRDELEAWLSTGEAGRRLH